MLRKRLPDPADKLNKVLGVPVCHVQADELNLRDLSQDVGEELEVCLSCARAAGGEGESIRAVGGKLEPLIHSVVLVNAGEAAMLQIIKITIHSFAPQFGRNYSLTCVEHNTMLF